MPVDKLCTSRVLVMDRLMGMNLETFCKTATPEAKQRAGDLLTQVFHESAYVFRAVHADPHGGNYLFHSDGRVSLIDFGCVKRLSMSFMHDYAMIANAIVDDDYEKMVAAAREMDLLTTDSPESAQALWEFVQTIRGPFDGEFVCGGPEDRLAEGIRSKGKSLMAHKDIQPPRDILFLHRTLMGTYSMLCKFSHTANYEQIRRKYATIAIQVARGEREDVGWK